MTKSYNIVFIIALLSFVTIEARSQSASWNVYLQLLTLEERNAISETGEITKQLDLRNPEKQRLQKGSIKVLKSSLPGGYNFVEIGTWITHSTTTGTFVHRKFIDTTFYDNLGNVISSVRYYKHKSGFLLSSKVTKVQSDIAFIQHHKMFRDNILIEEYRLRVIDSDSLKSDIAKQKTFIGEWNKYSKDGRLRSQKVFNEDGIMLSEEKYAR